MKYVYIAAPFTAETFWEIQKNINVAEQIAHRLVAIRVFPVCPHLMTGLTFIDEQTPEFWYEGTLGIMKKCDAIIVEGYGQGSIGVQKEVEVALELKIPIFDCICTVEKWLIDSTYRYDQDYMDFISSLVPSPASVI